MKKLILALSCCLSLSVFGQPKNIQAKVIEVKNDSRHKVSGKAVSMKGDTIFFKIGFRGLGKVRAVKVGTWLTIHADYSDKQRKWYMREIKINVFWLCVRWRFKPQILN